MPTQPTTLPTIAFLGTGAMGSRMARRLVDAGYPVRVWNRTAERAAAVEGAEPWDDPRDAVRDADVALSMLRSDDACRHVWLERGALEALGEGALAVECSTVSVAYARELARHAEDHGVDALDAPLAGTRPQAEAGQLIFLLGGKAEHVERATPLLETMGRAWHHVGGHGAGAALKLALNAHFATQLAQVAELLAFLQSQGVDGGAALETLSQTPVLSPAAAAAGSAMLAGQFAPAFPIDLVCKDLSLMQGAAEASEIPVSEATRAVFERAHAAGYADDNITGIAQLYG